LSKSLINIAILEPSQIITEGLSNILLKTGTYSKIFKIDSLNEFNTKLFGSQIDIAIINPNQIQNKLKEFSLLKKSLPNTLWTGLVYTFFDQTLLAQFDKIINITDSPESIGELIHKIKNADYHSVTGNEIEQLSEREIEVLKLLIKGLSNKEIGDKLNISIHTVISHRKNISQKTGIKSQAGLTIYAISNKIVQIEDCVNCFLNYNFSAKNGN